MKRRVAWRSIPSICETQTKRLKCQATQMHRKRFRFVLSVHGWDMVVILMTSLLQWNRLQRKHNTPAHRLLHPISSRNIYRYFLWFQMHLINVNANKHRTARERKRERGSYSLIAVDGDARNSHSAVVWMLFHYKNTKLVCTRKRVNLMRYTWQTRCLRQEIGKWHSLLLIDKRKFVECKQWLLRHYILFLFNSISYFHHHFQSMHDRVAFAITLTAIIIISLTESAQYFR